MASEIPKASSPKNHFFDAANTIFFVLKIPNLRLQKKTCEKDKIPECPLCARSKEPTKNNRKSGRGGWKSFENVSGKPSALSIQARKKLSFIDTLPHVLNCVLNITDR